MNRKSPNSELELHLNRWLRWFRLRRAVQWAGHGLAFGLAVALGFALVAVLLGELLQSEFVWVVLVTALASLMAAAVAGFAWPVQRQAAARHFDHAFGLKERLSTALELAGSSHSARIAPELVERQLQDTLAAARTVQARRSLPLRLDWRELALALTLAGLGIFVWARGGEYFQAALQNRLIQQAIAAEVAQIEAIKAEIEASETLTEEQKEALTRPLDEALQKLVTATTIEQAASVLQETEQRLNALSDPEAQQQAQGLQEAGSALGSQDGSPLQEFGQDLAQGQYQSAAQELLNMDPASLTPAEAADLADQLNNAAEALASSNPELAEQLRQAGQALRQGDTEAARQALQQAAETLANTGQQVAESSTARQAAQAVGEGQQRMIQAGQSAQSPAAQSGQGQGQGQSQGQAGGSGRGEGSGDSGAGTEAGSGPIQQGNSPGDGGERPYEQIYVPQRLGGTEGEDVYLPGSGATGEDVVGEGNTSPGDPAASIVPYTEVYAQYENAYRQAIDNGSVPVFLRDLVHDYFNSLQP